MFALTAAEFTAEGAVNVLINRYIPLWGRAHSIISDTGLLFCPTLSHVVYKFLGDVKSSPAPATFGTVTSRVNRTMTKMLAMVANKR